MIMTIEEKLDNLFDELNKDYNNSLHKLLFILGILTGIDSQLTTNDIDEAYEEIAKMMEKEGAK